MGDAIPRWAAPGDCWLDGNYVRSVKCWLLVYQMQCCCYSRNQEQQFFKGQFDGEFCDVYHHL